jgi:hypothetical protein
MRFSPTQLSSKAQRFYFQLRQESIYISILKHLCDALFVARSGVDRKPLRRRNPQERTFDEYFSWPEL